MSPVDSHDARALQAHLAETYSAQPLIGVEHDDLTGALHGQMFGQKSAASPLARCLIRYLQAIGWTGTSRELAEALPHFQTDIDATGLSNTLANLGQPIRRLAVRGSKIDPRLLPAILLRPGNCPLLLLRQTEPDSFEVHAFDEDSTKAAGTETVGADSLVGDLYVRQPQDEIEPDRSPANWLTGVLMRFRRQFLQLFVMGTLINLAGLVTPLFVMLIYDRVIPARNLTTLAMLGAGMIAFVVAELALQLLRNRLIAHIGARLDYGTATAAFNQVLRLPAAMTLTAPVSTQASRLREFDNLRDICTGSLATLMFDAPFLVLYLGMIWLLGGPMFFISAGMIVAYAVLGLIMRGTMRRHASRSSALTARRHAFMLETFGKIRAIRRLTLGETWLTRAKTFAADASWSQFRHNQANEVLQAVGQFISNAAAILTIGLGSLRVIDGEMSIGALVAVVGLTWRTLAPLHGTFTTLGRLEQIALTFRRANQMMAMKPEPDLVSDHRRVTRKLHGAIAVERAYFRYPGTAGEPAIMGVSLAAQPGEHIAIYGESGAGKSTLLKLMLGLYDLQAGQILYDGIDMRQVNPVELRRKVGFVPQVNHFFYGTIAQNLRLADLTASDESLLRACDILDIRSAIEALPEGFNTRIGNQGMDRLSEGLLQRLSIARALVKQSPLLLIDEPSRALDQAGDSALMAMLRQLHGHTTVIMCSQRPSHLRMADRLLVLRKGQSVAYASPSQILDRPTREHAA